MKWEACCAMTGGKLLTLFGDCAEKASNGPEENLSHQADMSSE
jgi:hypothetical protein